MKGIIMKKLRKTTCILLCASLLSCAFLSSCSEAPSESKETEQPVQNVQEEIEEVIVEDEEPAHQYPEKDMDGATVTILSEDWAAYEPLNMDDIMAEESNGNIMNDSVF